MLVGPPVTSARSFHVTELHAAESDARRYKRLQEYTTGHVRCGRESKRLCMQDPPYDPGSFAKIVTRDASKEGGSAPACSSNVRQVMRPNGMA